MEKSRAMKVEALLFVFRCWLKGWFPLFCISGLKDWKVEITGNTESQIHACLGCLCECE